MDVYPGTVRESYDTAGKNAYVRLSGYQKSRPDTQARPRVAGRDNKFAGRLTFSGASFFRGTQRLADARKPFLADSEGGQRERICSSINQPAWIGSLHTADDGNYGTLPHVHVGRHVRDACRLHVIKHRMITGGGSDASASSPAEACSRDAPCPLNVCAPVHGCIKESP